MLTQHDTKKIWTTTKYFDARFNADATGDVNVMLDACTTGDISLALDAGAIGEDKATLDDNVTGDVGKKMTST